MLATHIVGATLSPDYIPACSTEIYMKPNELRIGNWIKYQNKEYQIDGVTDSRVSIYGVQYGTDDGLYLFSDITTIPLTDEILERCGFVEKGFVNEDQDDVEWLESVELPELKFRNGVISVDDWMMPHIEHIHQLQNLYFSLTGEELEIKAFTDEKAST